MERTVRKATRSLSVIEFLPVNTNIAVVAVASLTRESPRSIVAGSPGESVAIRYHDASRSFSFLLSSLFSRQRALTIGIVG